MPIRTKLTKRLIEATKPPAEEVRLWDAEVKGFVLRVFPSGRRTFALKYRIGSRQRWFTIGEFGSPWTVEEARSRANAVLRAADDGVDLQAVKQERRHALTVAELVERYLTDGPRAKPDKRASSRQTLATNTHVIRSGDLGVHGASARSNVEFLRSPCLLP